MSAPQIHRDAPVPSEEFGQMAGEYRLGRKLGEGGFGAVFEAEHPVLKRRAAVKVLHRAAGVNSDAVLRFVSEAQAVNQIKSRHIVDVFSFGKLPDGRHFYVMDLLLGETLDRHRSRLGRLDPITTLQLLRPIAAALDAAHAAGIVHRDLKPQNVFLAWETSGETVPKLLDFGMAKLLSDSAVDTVSGTPVGTPLYMSPEQARGEAVTLRADVYALGVVCHELLTGVPPISGASAVTVLMAQIVQPPPPVSSVCSDLPACLDAPILSMLEKNPDARPASASAALDAIERALAEVDQRVPSGLPRLEPPPVESTAALPSGPRSPSEVARAESLGVKSTQYHPMFGESQRPAAPPRRWLWPVLAAAVGASLFALTRLETPPLSGAVSGTESGTVSGTVSSAGVNSSPSPPLARELPLPATNPAQAANPAQATPSAPSTTASEALLPAPSAATPASSTPAAAASGSPKAATTSSRPTAPSGTAHKPAPSSPAAADPIPKDLESPF